MDASDYAFTIAWGPKPRQMTVKARSRQSNSPGTADLENLLQFTGRPNRHRRFIQHRLPVAGPMIWRNNETVDMPPRKADIHSLRLVSNSAEAATFEATTGKVCIRCSDVILPASLMLRRISHLRRSVWGRLALICRFHGFFEKSTMPMPLTHPV